MSGGGNREQMSQATDTLAVELEETRRGNAFVIFLKRLVKEKPLGAIGGFLVLVMLFTGIFADIIAPYNYKAVHPVDRLSPPSTQYILGTDSLGRDVLSRIIYGARVSMIVGLAATALNTFVSVLIGLTSGYLGGKFDLVVQRLVDAWLCFPGLVVFLLLMSLLGAGMLQMILVLGIAGGISASRGPRSYAFWLKESVYIEASRSIGASTWRILGRHLLPNILPLVIVGFSIGVGGVILAEASLSFLGFGIPPPFPSWGQMIGGPARYQMERAPWIVLWPGLALTLAVYGVNMFGDAVRDLVDPRLRGGVGGLGGRGMEMARKALKKQLEEAEKDRQKVDVG
jgi:peptide/nickel transport system permease protein